MALVTKKQSKAKIETQVKVSNNVEAWVWRSLLLLLVISFGAWLDSIRVVLFSLTISNVRSS